MRWSWYQVAPPAPVLIEDGRSAQGQPIVPCQPDAYVCFEDDW